MKKITMIALAMFTTVGAGAQTIYDATIIAQKELKGTARFVGMGGAMGALGGDISTIGTNPAGIGIYRSNDATVSYTHLIGSDTVGLLNKTFKASFTQDSGKYIVDYFCARNSAECKF